MVIAEILELSLLNLVIVGITFIIGLFTLWFAYQKLVTLLQWAQRKRRAARVQPRLDLSRGETEPAIQPVETSNTQIQIDQNDNIITGTMKDKNENVTYELKQKILSESVVSSRKKLLEIMEAGINNKDTTIPISYAYDDLTLLGAYRNTIFSNQIVCNVVNETTLDISVTGTAELDLISITSEAEVTDSIADQTAKKIEEEIKIDEQEKVDEKAKSLKSQITTTNKVETEVSAGASTSIPKSAKGAGGIPNGEPLPVTLEMSAGVKGEIFASIPSPPEKPKATAGLNISSSISTSPGESIETSVASASAGINGGLTGSITVSSGSSAGSTANSQDKSKWEFYKKYSKTTLLNFAQAEGGWLRKKIDKYEQGQVIAVDTENANDTEENSIMTSIVDPINQFMHHFISPTDSDLNLLNKKTSEPHFNEIEFNDEDQVEIEEEMNRLTTVGSAGVITLLNFMQAEGSPHHGVSEVEPDNPFPLPIKRDGIKTSKESKEGPAIAEEDETVIEETGPGSRKGNEKESYEVVEESAKRSEKKSSKLIEEKALGIKKASGEVVQKNAIESTKVSTKESEDQSVPEPKVNKEEPQILSRTNIHTLEDSDPLEIDLTLTVQVPNIPNAGNEKPSDSGN